MSWKPLEKTTGFAQPPSPTKMSLLIIHSKFEFFLTPPPFPHNVIYFAVFCFEFFPLVYCFRLAGNINTELQKCQNIPPCDANCELSNWEEWSSCSVSCQDTRINNLPTRSRKREKLKDSVGKVGKLQHNQISWLIPSRFSLN